MSLTKEERKTLYGIETQVALFFQRLDALSETQERLKVDMTSVKSTIYENGLNSRVRELHDWMKEQKLAAIKLNGETKILGMKINGELRNSIINGLFILLGIFLTYWLK